MKKVKKALSWACLVTVTVVTGVVAFVVADALSEPGMLKSHSDRVRDRDFDVEKYYAEKYPAEETTDETPDEESKVIKVNFQKSA